MIAKRETEELAEIRRKMLHMVHYSHASHIGSALSVVDILYTIYNRVADITTDNVHSTHRDRVILSKGHSSIAMYATLAMKGIIPEDFLEKYYVDGGCLPGHLDKESCAGIDCSAGSLGHGFSIGIGMALAHPDKKVFVIIGDGELNEGSVWEGIIFCGRHKIPNLCMIIDFNNLQAFARADEIANYSRLSATLANFGLEACDVDGHNLDELEAAMRKETASTKAIVAHTTKGKGVSYMEGQFVWHYKSPNDEQLSQALEELQS